MTHDPNKLTPTELHAVQALVAAVQQGHDEDARFWVRRVELMSALAKMRAQSRSTQS
jgi:hypothetical protein